MTCLMHRAVLGILRYYESTLIEKYLTSKGISPPKSFHRHHNLCRWSTQFGRSKWHEEANYTHIEIFLREEQRKSIRWPALMDTSGTTKSSPVFCYVRKYTLTAVTLLSSMTWLTLCYLSSYRDAVQYTTFQPPNPQIYKRNTSELGEFSCSGGKRILIPPSVFSPNGYPITALSTAPGIRHWMDITFTGGINR